MFEFKSPQKIIIKVDKSLLTKKQLIISKIQNMIEQQHQNKRTQDKREILDAYRTLGSFVSGKMILSQTQPLSFAVPTRNSYKVYSDSLAIKVVSPPLSGEVKSVLSYNDYSYVRAGHKVTKMKYHHIVKQWVIPQENNQNVNYQSTLMKFANIILLGEGKRVYVLDEKENIIDDELDFMELKQAFIGMIHPVTYINKLVVYNQTSITLINPLSNKTLYEYPTLKQYVKANSLQIVTIQSSKLVNIIALSLSNGQILIFNLKKDEIVFKFKLKQPAICIAFCDQQSMMATSDEKGNVVLWDLQNKKILYKFQQFIQGAIDSLIFTPGQPIITCGSSVQNCIRQLRINLEDNRILTLFRERVGITQPIEKLQLMSNNQLLISSKSQSMFSSLYSHTNNYKLSRVLDSSSPYHIVSKHFSVQLYKNQTVDKSFNIHQSAYLGKISLSQKYYIVATKTRLIKLGVSGVQMKISGIKQIVLFQEHFVYVLTHNAILVLDFVTLQIIKQIPISQCSHSVVNHLGNLLAFHNKQSSSIQVYDMEKIQLAREYKLKQGQNVHSLAFSSDNKYLLSSHDNLLTIWSVVHNNMFKEFILQKNIISMQFTEDNQFFLSVFQNQREINIWNNYIGKLSSNRQTQVLNFNVTINHCEQDFRTVLKRKEHQLLVKNQQETEQVQTNIGDDILAFIPDSKDSIPEYRFESTQKWLPLIYYDEIKQRNTIQNAKQVALPFFLDFRNIDEERKKMQNQIKQDLLNKKKEKQQKIDQHLKDDTHEIKLSDENTPQDYKKCLTTLETLSIAEIDYQLRTFLLNPVNKTYLLKMFEHVYNSNQNQSMNLCEQFVNIIFHRTLYLIGSQIFDEDLKETLGNLISSYKNRMEWQKIKVDRCIAITQKLI